jgi:hypothetical protein
VPADLLETVDLSVDCSSSSSSLQSMLPRGSRTADHYDRKRRVSVELSMSSVSIDNERSTSRSYRDGRSCFGGGSQSTHGLTLSVAHLGLAGLPCRLCAMLVVEEYWPWP